MNFNGVVSNPAVAQNADTTQPLVAQGRAGELLVRELGGRGYAAAARGNLYLSTTLVGGVTVPAPATTLASKAGIINPLGSTRNVELVGLGLSSVTIEVALKNFAMEFQLNASQTGGVATAITKLTAVSQPLSVGNNAAQAFAYTAATMTNAAANTLILPLFGDYATAVGFIPTWFKFDGEIVMGPDTVMAITNVAALAAVQVVYLWAEWPI